MYVVVVRVVRGSFGEVLNELLESDVVISSKNRAILCLIKFEMIGMQKRSKYDEFLLSMCLIDL